MLRALAIAVAIALPGALLSACGGSDAGGPERAAYIARADRICHQTHVQAAPLLSRLAAAAPGLTPAKARALAPLGRRVHDIGTTYVTRLTALRQPHADRGRLQTFVSRTREVVGAIGQAATALGAGQTVAVLGMLQSAQSSADKANAAAADYGMNECASVLKLG